MSPVEGMTNCGSIVPLCQESTKANSPFFVGQVYRPGHFLPRQNRSPPPRSWLSTCYNVYNAESCSTETTSIYQCSTGFGGRQSVINPLVGGFGTTCGGGLDPRVRVGEFFCESGSGFQPNPIEFDGIRPPSVNPSVRITTSFQPNTLSIACKCPCMLSSLFMDTLPVEKPQTLCERFWGNLARFGGGCCLWVRRSAGIDRSISVVGPRHAVRF